MDNVLLQTQRTEMKFPLPHVSAEQVARAINDQETVRYMSAVPSMRYTEKDAAGFLLYLQSTEKSATELELGVFWKETGAFIGMCALENMDQNQGACELGYWLCKSYVGQGVMLECASALLGYAKRELHMKRVNAFVVTEHARSIRLLQRLGFERKQRLVNDAVNKGIPVDRFRYALEL